MWQNPQLASDCFVLLLRQHGQSCVPTGAVRHARPSGRETCEPPDEGVHMAAGDDAKTFRQD
jgi:hypothetical protein